MVQYKCDKNNKKEESLWVYLKLKQNVQPK